MIKLTINRNKWARGGLNGDAALLNDQGAMCCLGFACKKLGAKDGDIRALGTPQQLHLSQRQKFARFGQLLNNKGCDRKLTQEAVDINDNIDLNELEREAELKPILRKLGFDVKFVG